MEAITPFWRNLGLTGCASGPQAKPGIARANGKAFPEPPGLKVHFANEPSKDSFEIRCYHIRHVWAGNDGYPAATPYRALIGVWSHGPNAVAELYFHDIGQKLPANPDPNDKSIHYPYQIHFPISALDPVLHELRFAERPVYLVYYNPAGERQWAVAVYSAEDQRGYIKPNDKHSKYRRRSSPPR